MNKIFRTILIIFSIIITILIVTTFFLELIIMNSTDPDPDHERKLLHINPGAAGRQGIHHMKSIVRFSILGGGIENIQLIELGKRA